MVYKLKATSSGYDNYVNPKLLAVALGVFLLLVLMPTPAGMKDVGVEYTAGKPHVLDFYAQELFRQRYSEVHQWQAKTAEVLESAMRKGVVRRQTLLKRDQKQIAALGVEVSSAHYPRFRETLERLTDERFSELMLEARSLRHDKLSYQSLNAKEKQSADRSAWKLKVCVAMAAFVVICFVTEAIPLPGVAFCIGLILVFTGIVTRREVASLFWSDACWFIMGSLMFAAAFVKTGVDKRICLLLFRSLARPRLGLITAIMILVISPVASFISDHALAAMFLPIGIILYTNSLSARVPVDKELAKMLMICICMACNIGGFGAPSGGARNVIIMTYLEDMFAISMGYGEWMIYGLPFVVVMMPVLWLLVNWRFKPHTRDLGPALATLKEDIGRMGRWNRRQIIAVAIFLVMLLGWITESNLLLSLTGIRLGIGVLAVAGAVAYLLFGVVNWRDYHEKVDWGVVWLYAGAIIFGRVLDESGAAYWMARSVVEAAASIGMAGGTVLVALGAAVTSGMTNLMADGPAAAAVGPVTLNMAAVASPGTTLVPFMGLATACASSFAYLLIIGTPPNAIVYASGYLEPKDFLRVGIPCFVLAFVVLMLLTVFYWPLLGFQGLRPV
jgi:sodium-dependent dicarboxylate transporter 2/3/5